MPDEYAPLLKAGKSGAGFLRRAIFPTAEEKLARQLQKTHELEAKKHYLEAKMHEREIAEQVKKLETKEQKTQARERAKAFKTFKQRLGIL